MLSSQPKRIPASSHLIQALLVFAEDPNLAAFFIPSEAPQGAFLARLQTTEQLGLVANAPSSKALVPSLAFQR